MTEMNGNDQNRNLELAFQLALRKLDSQNSNNIALDSKIGVLLAFVGAISASAILGLDQNTELIGINIFTLGVLGVYATLLFLVTATYTKTFLDPPDFSTFYSHLCVKMENHEVMNQVVADIQDCFNKNNAIQTYKAAMYNRAVLCLFGSITLLLLGIFEK